MLLVDGCPFRKSNPVQPREAERAGDSRQRSYARRPSPFCAGGGPPSVGHQLDEHLNRSRTMGPRKFGDGRIQVRPTARVEPRVPQGTIAWMLQISRGPIALWCLCNSYQKNALWVAPDYETNPTGCAPSARADRGQTAGFWVPGCSIGHDFAPLSARSGRGRADAGHWGVVQPAQPSEKGGPQPSQPAS
jgi:hypothetical protein